MAFYLSSVFTYTAFQPKPLIPLVEFSWLTNTKSYSLNGSPCIVLFLGWLFFGGGRGRGCPYLAQNVRFYLRQLGRESSSISSAFTPFPFVHAFLNRSASHFACVKLVLNMFFLPSYN